MKLEISYKKETGKYINTWRLNTTLNNDGLTRSRKTSKVLKTNENTVTQNVWDIALLTEIHSSTGLFHETRKILK